MSFNQLKDAFPSTIARMKDSFDTHTFVLMLAKHHQRAYVQALADQDSETPFHNLHKLIGKALSRSGLLEKNGKASSVDIFGRKKSKVQCWKPRGTKNDQ